MVQYRLKTSRQVNKFNDTQPGKGFEHAVRTQGMINTEHGASQKKRHRERYRREYVVHYFATSLIAIELYTLLMAKLYWYFSSSGGRGEGIPVSGLLSRDFTG